MQMLKYLACVAGSLLLLSSCTSMSDVFGTIFEPSETVYATVEHASAPKYHKASYDKKGNLTRDAYYSQNFNVKTDDGRRLRGSHEYSVYDTGKQVYGGARGQARIGLKTGRLKDFEVKDVGDPPSPSLCASYASGDHYLSGNDKGCMMQYYERTESVRAKVEQASKPKFYKKMNVGSEEAPVWVDAHYTQKIDIRTEDGRQLSGTYTYDRGEEDNKVSAGLEGVATIGENSGKLLKFEVRYWDAIKI